MRTAIDLRTDTFHMLRRFDNTDTALWQKVLSAITAIYTDEVMAQKRRREEQKVRLRKVVDSLSLSDVQDWKQTKEDALIEKYS